MYFLFNFDYLFNFNAGLLTIGAESVGGIIRI